MAAPPQPGRGRKDRTVAYSGLFRLHDWLYMAPLALIGVGLGVWGLAECTGTDCQIGGWGARFIKAVGLIRGNMPYALDAQHPWQLTVAQLLMPGIFLIAGAKLLLINLRRDFRVALARRQSNHTIVCGLGSSGRQIVENLCADRAPVVAITLDDTEANAVACERLGVAVLKGDATQLGMLRLAGLLHANTVVVTCGSDTTNIEVALRIKAALDSPEEHHRVLDYLPESLRVRFLEWLRAAPIDTNIDATGRTRPLKVLPEVRSAWLLELVRSHPTATLSSEAVAIQPVDLSANAARLLLERPEFGRIWRMCTGGRTPALQPHLLLVGLGDLGMKIVSRAVQTTFALPGCKLAVTVLDQQGEASAAVLNARYPGMHDLVDWEFVQTVFDAENPAAWPEVRQAVEAALGARPARWTTVAAIIALKNDRDALHAALQMRERLDTLGSSGTPVFVRLRQRHELGQFASSSLDGPQNLLDRLTAFGDLGELTSFNLLNDVTQDGLARALHDNYRAGGTGAPPSEEADKPWNELPERFKESSRASADHIPVKLAAAGLRLAPHPGPPIELTPSEIETMSEIEHHRWMVERLVAGWTHGAERDAVARRHPDLVPWDALEEGVREKDRIVVRTITTSIAAAQMSIRRERLIDASGGDLTRAGELLNQTPAGAQGVVIFDPRSEGSSAFAAAAAARARLWVLWREGSHTPLVAIKGRAAMLREGVELAVSVRELAAIFGMPVPALSGRRTGPTRRRGREARAGIERLG
jgi:hypothetical protein